MVLRYTFAYFIARGLPGIITLAAVSVYTRLLSPADYGYYALVLAGVSLANSVSFYWLQVGLKRFALREYATSDALLSTVLFSFVSLTGVLAIGVLAVFATLGESDLRPALIVGFCLLAAQGFFEINIQLAASKLQPVLYGVFSFARACLALMIGVGLIYMGASWQGPLIGIALAAALSTLMFGSSNWRGTSLKRPNQDARRDLVRYGVPISLAALLAYATVSLDRFLISYFMDRSSVGQYSAGFEVTNYAIQVAMVVVNLAGVPLVVRALEREGMHAAREHLIQQGVLLLASAVPITVACVVIAENISAVLLGAAFGQASAAIMPWLALATIILAFRAYYFDLAFQLAERTDYQLLVAAFTLVVGAAANIALIPRYGISGAAYAFLIAAGASLAVSVVLGKRVFQIPVPLGAYLRVVAAGALMAGTLKLTSDARGLEALMIQLMMGVSAYALGLVMLNVAGCRTTLATLIRRWCGDER